MNRRQKSDQSPVKKQSVNNNQNLDKLKGVPRHFYLELQKVVARLCDV